MLRSINPTNNELIKSYDEMSSNESANIISLVNDEFNHWKQTSFLYRSELMKNAAGILRKNSNDYAVLMTYEMGKPVAQARAEVEKCVWVCEYYADNAEKFLVDEVIKTEATKSFVSYQPLGVILAIMPWNFPFWQVFRFAVPNLMAGNTGVLKHASNVSGCALAIEDVFKQAGFPQNAFRTLLVSSKNTNEIIANEKIKAVTLTGSVPAGKSVASYAGSLIKKTVLELGGSDPYVVLADADLQMAAASCVNSRLINAGQSCIAAKRFIVVESVYDEFEKLYLQFMSEKKMGDPFDETNDLGPQASIQLRDELHQQVVKSIEQGAEIILGGKIPQMPGAFYPPTILKNVKPGMVAFDEELFGPVAALIKAKDENEAIELANQSKFGLGAALFTNDIKKGEMIAKEKLNAGCCFVNDFVKSDPRLPFGGINESGYGRELSPFGIKEFVNIKSVYIK